MTDLESQEPIQQVLSFNKEETSKEEDAVVRVQHEGDYIQFGPEKYLKSELVEAFGGTLNPGLSPPPKHNLANPVPLGLSSFALSCFVLSLINCEARGVVIPNVVVGLAYFYAGAIELISGMFLIASGNTFGGAALSSYSGFWMSWAAIQTKSFGMLDAYTDEKELANALGIYFIAWFILTFFLMVMTLKSTLAFFAIFFFLMLTFLLLAIFQFTGIREVKIAAGVIGLITAFVAAYNAYAGLATPQNSFFPVHVIPLPDLELRKSQ